MKKLNIMVIFGGNSQEHSVSEMSAQEILKNISSKKYNIYMVGITKNREWFLYTGDINNICCCQWEKDVNNKKVSISLNKYIIIEKNNNFEKIKIDVAFPVLHGKNGEDGTIQGLLELASIPYVGCRTTSSASCMDKIITNTMLSYYKIDKAKFHWFTKLDFENNQEKCIQNTENIIKKYPMFVKPANAGSSVGISKVRTQQELIIGIKKALQEDNRILIEEEIIGRELECAVLGIDDLTVSQIGEIIPANDFYDYNAKYVLDSKTVIPEDLSLKIIEKIQEISKKAYKIMDCRGLSRIDFFLEKDTNRIFLNEINTMPGFTSISMYPKLMEKSGISYSDLVDRLISFALNL